MNSIVLSDNSLFLFSLGLLIGSVIGTTGVVIIFLIGISYVYRDTFFDILDKTIIKPSSNYQKVIDFFNELRIGFFKK